MQIKAQIGKVAERQIETTRWLQIVSICHKLPPYLNMQQ
jgi:hypothetical protein